jgi:hypothetical protein
VLLDGSLYWMTKGNRGFSGHNGFYEQNQDEVYPKMIKKIISYKKGDPLICKLMLSVISPGKRESLDGKEFERPPRPRQRLLNLDELFMREITVKWRHAKTDRLCLKDHPP